MKIVIERIDASNFRDLGQLIRMPGENEKSPTAAGETFVYHGILAVMDCADPVQFGIYKAEKKDLIVKQLEAHQQTEELLVALEGGFFIPATVSKQDNGAEIPDHHQIKGFMVAEGEGIVFKKGMWHCSPIPAAETCTVLVAFKHNTHINDVTLYTMEESICLIDKTE